jgi:hypothetical protein
MGQLTLNDLRTSFEQNKGKVRQISKDKLNVLWLDGYYDGMLSGIVEHEGQKLKFEIITDYSQNTSPRTFAIINLTEKEIEEETYRHNLFKKHVADYKNKIYKPETEHNLYFDQVSKRGNLNYESSLVYGWFIE